MGERGGIFLAHEYKIFSQDKEKIKSDLELSSIFQVDHSHFDEFLQDFFEVCREIIAEKETPKLEIKESLEDFRDDLHTFYNLK